MFGHDWDEAEATIVARSAKYSGSGGATHTYVADVRMADEQVFRTTLHEPFIATDFWPPSVGDTVSVLVEQGAEPAAERKVKFDKDDARLSFKAVKDAQKHLFDHAQQQPPGTPSAAWAAPSVLPDAIAAQLAQLGIRSGQPVQVFGADSAQAQAVLAAFTHGATPTEHTPAERLTQLDELRKHDLLTPQEYDEQRKRILDQL